MGNLKKVLVLYVGGTIGMKRNEQGVLIPVPNAFLIEVKYHSEMHDPTLAARYNIKLKENELILPTRYGLDDLLYQIVEYDPLLDSSNMTPRDWDRIAKNIESQYHSFDGFVVLHGTDTLAYTSSALSFMLEGLQKPVILTGSQIPIFETRSDAKNNIISSLIIAGCYKVPEVCVLFANKLYRGNRVTKFKAMDLDAFDSPNYHSLADVGVGIELNQNYIRKIDNRVTFKVHTDLDVKVAKIAVFPTLSYDMLKSILDSSIRGLVLETYGTGNLPSQRTDLIGLLKKAVDKEILIINVTQCSRGMVGDALYETGKIADEIGIIAGEDITGEAALAKLSYVLAIPKMTYQQRVEKMKANLRGEITIPTMAV
ncbi:unnamed protein product [Phaedon cochleariae]|uniref:asparaginase n=1 Tax=Phaedon cochleariae TaxID=80249 RepID=A0A9P0DQ55_PHACE|nr:unnamed protein product [Phaedon cochleariae]